MVRWNEKSDPIDVVILSFKGPTFPLSVTILELKGKISKSL